MIALVAIEGLPEIAAGDRIGELVAARAELRDGDVLVVSQKIVSKAEGRTRRLSQVEAGERARQLGAELGRDPALVQLVLDESRTVIRATESALITETNGGWICANAGIDASNVAEPDAVTLLPIDADGSARRIRTEIVKACGSSPAVVVADSFGRPWRVGQSEVAIGCAGIDPLDDWRGRTDRAGRKLSATVIALADQVAAASDLARDKDSGAPAVVIRGLERHVTPGDGPGAIAIQRPAAEDLFR